MLTRRNCVLGSAALAFAGCTAREQTQPEGQGTGSSSGLENADIDWGTYQGEAINLLLIEHWWTDAITSRLDEFEQLTGMKVNTNVIGDQDAYYQQAVVALSSGASTYDGLMVGSLNSGQYMNANWLVPLDDYFGDSGFLDMSWYDIDDVMEAGRAAGTRNGEMFTMPVSAEAGVVIYREDLVPEPPRAHDDLLNGAERANTGDVSGAVGRGARGLDIVWVWTNFLLTEGGRFFENGEPAVDSPESVRATEIYVEQLLGSYGPNGVANMGWLEANNYFNEGNAALYPDASGLVSLTLEEKNAHADDVAVSRWPQGAEGTPPSPNYFYWSIGIPKSSAKQEQAAMFYAWATSPEISMAIGREAGTPVARDSVWADEQFREFYPPDIVEEMTANYAQVEPGAVPYERPTFPQEVNALSVELVSVLNGKDVTQALDAAASAMALAAK